MEKRNKQLSYYRSKMKTRELSSWVREMPQMG